MQIVNTFHYILYYIQYIYYTFNSIDSVIVLYNFIYRHVWNLNLRYTFKLFRWGRNAPNMLKVGLQVQDFGFGNCHDRGTSANS